MMIQESVDGIGELFNQVVGCQQHYAKGWREFMVYPSTDYSTLTLRALM